MSLRALWGAGSCFWRLRVFFQGFSDPKLLSMVKFVSGSRSGSRLDPRIQHSLDPDSHKILGFEKRLTNDQPYLHSYKTIRSLSDISRFSKVTIISADSSCVLRRYHKRYLTHIRRAFELGGFGIGVGKSLAIFNRYILKSFVL
jgi:hypothetical protein